MKREIPLHQLAIFEKIKMLEITETGGVYFFSFSLVFVIGANWKIKNKTSIKINLHGKYINFSQNTLVVFIKKGHPG